MENDELICSCNSVYKNRIVKAIKQQDLKTVEEVSNATNAGTVCGVCHGDIQMILDETRK